MQYHTQTYSEPSKTGDKYHLPDLEVWSEDGKTWSVHACMPGCMPDSDVSEFSTACEAFEYAYESAEIDWSRLFRYAFQGTIARLRGSIATALESEALLEKLAIELDVIDSDGLQHVEELAHEAAKARFSVSP